MNFFFEMGRIQLFGFFEKHNTFPACWIQLDVLFSENEME